MAQKNRPTPAAWAISQDEVRRSFEIMRGCNNIFSFSRPQFSFWDWFWSWFWAALIRFSNGL